MVQVRIPEDIGSSLRVFQEDTYEARIRDVYVKLSKESQEPKATVSWVVTSEYSGKKAKDHITTVGEVVLETFSLQPQAVWNLNDLYTAATGDRIPQGEFEGDSFEQLLKNALTGFTCKIRLIQDDYTGSTRMKVEERIYG